MRHTVEYRTQESSYEMVVESDDQRGLGPPEWIVENEEGLLSCSDGMSFESFAEMTNHYKCEIVSVDSDPGN